jgi:hypothetical protein
LTEIADTRVVEKPHVLGLFKYPKGHANVQMQGAQTAEPRGVYGNTLSGAVCSATPAFAGVNSADERFVKPPAFSSKECV